MSLQRLIALVVALFVMAFVISLVLATTGGSQSSDGRASFKTALERYTNTCHGGLSREFDPGKILLLQPNSIGRATAVALRRETRASRPLVVSATLAPDDHERGPEAKFQCGRRVWQRTVVVYIRLRAMLPSQSLSQRVDFVGRFPGGYRVWEVVH
jgi:hypothetical protein